MKNRTEINKEMNEQIARAFFLRTIPIIRNITEIAAQNIIMNPRKPGVILSPTFPNQEERIFLIIISAFYENAT